MAQSSGDQGTSIATGAGRAPARIGLTLAAIALVAGSLAVWLFPRAFPTVALSHRITRQMALQRADSFFRAHALAPPRARTAVRFASDDSLLTFVELAAGGKDTLDALVRGRDVAPFAWSVRAFVDHDPHEARVRFAPDGRIVSFGRTLAEADRRPTLAPDSAQTLAARVLERWLGESPARWQLATSSYETRKGSGRVDRTFTYERTDRRVGSAPLRLEVVIAGDEPASARAYVAIPEAFSRRYGEMRSANDLLAEMATVGIIALVLAVGLVLWHHSKLRMVRWKQALVAGAVIGVLLTAAGLNGVPSSWYDYDTATSPVVFETILVIGALLEGALMGLLVALTLAAAEVLARRAFPAHLDWWKLWRNRGTRQVAGRVAGGYAVAAIAFAYVALFYVITQRVFGWWVPSELLDDPNQIATPMPWLGGIAMSLQAGVWEEALFRAVPLSLLSIWVGSRPHRGRWMAAGVVASAIVFGFAHANYPSWPPYSRGVEIFLDACFWGVLFLQFGLIVTVIAHFAYDLVLFGLFAAMGTAFAYRLTAAVIALALFAPALAVAIQWLRARRLTDAGDDARFAAWRPATADATEAAPDERPARTLGDRSRSIAIATVVAGLLATLMLPRPPVLGAPFTVSRDRALAISDSVLRSVGVNPAGWRRLSLTADDTLESWPRFLSGRKADRLAGALARTYAPPSWWVVRYVHTRGGLGERAEEWRVRLFPDGVPLDFRHILPESARRDSPDAAEARRIALAAVVRSRFDTSRLVEAKFDETARPLRRDVTVTYTDSSVHLPAGAVARVWVSLAGAEPTVVRRGVELPEQFVRSDRDRQQRLLAVSAVCGIALIAAIVIGAIVVIRRRASPAGKPGIPRRAAVIAVAVLAALLVSSSANGLPSMLFAYDTAIPWGTYTASLSVGIALSIVPAFLIAGLWLVVDALRRRAGISLVPAGDGRDAVRDTLITGAALGSVLAILTEAGALAAHGSVPGAPQTLLDRALPVLSAALATPVSVAFAVPVIAIPVLVVVGLSRRTSVRLLLAVGFLLLLAGIGAVAEPKLGGFGARAVVLAVAAPVAVLFAIRAWGGVSAATWIVPALTQQGLSMLHAALHAPTPIEAAGSAFAVLLSAALLGLVAWRVRRSAAGTAAD